MQANLVSCLFILDSEKNGNIRKNDIKKIKILVTDEEELPEIPFKAKGIKNQIKRNKRKRKYRFYNSKWRKLSRRNGNYRKKL